VFQINLKNTLQIHYKTVPKSLRKKSVPFYKCHRFISDPFDIRYGGICELGNIGMACTVLKYVSLQKPYPKLFIKLGTNFEVGQKWKTAPFRFIFRTNNLENIHRET
jgi:hypothetical protein